ncbi:hypothetical protein CU669_12550 [Paramagnetospirillum kuznetsovii]|uniref:Lipoprotein n=1 Tax=Paramagnetospirillum kuznetsovii TaxID=2053833 RepID=A0A364NWQ6_9PROT|nr:hypothetical protein [Paramagnetospirillum kuznetsovii]RAU21524.1 hypothetical protein CU669_12550 [Paramagnetospirillum kuznetsovii]
MRRLLAPVLGLLLLGGCASMEPAPHCDMSRISGQRDLVPGPAMVPGESSPLKEMPMNSVNITDPAIMNKLYVRSIAARRTATGTVEVVAQVVNCTDFQQTAEARTQFYDSTGVASEPVSAWQRLHLSPRTSSAYRELSMGDKTVDGYMIEMRETK